MLQYSGIDYPGHISSANKFAVIHGRRVPATWIQEQYANQPIDLNFQTPNPLPLNELRRRIEENEFRTICKPFPTCHICHIYQRF